MRLTCRLFYTLMLCGTADYVVLWSQNAAGLRQDKQFYCSPDGFCLLAELILCRHQVSIRMDFCISVLVFIGILFFPEAILSIVYGVGVRNAALDYYGLAFHDVSSFCLATMCINFYAKSNEPTSLPLV